MRITIRMLLLVAMASVGVVAGVRAQGAPTPKLAYINSQRILSQAPGRAEAEAQFQREMTRYQEQIRRMGDSLQLLMADYNKQELILSPAAKEMKQKEIRSKEETYQQRIQQLQQQAQQREEELVRPIMQQINTVLTAIRAEDGYTFIFDVGAQGAAVVAADTTLDITQRVIARLKTVSASTTKPPARPTGAPSAPQPAGVSRPRNPPGDR